MCKSLDWKGVWSYCRWGWETDQISLYSWLKSIVYCRWSFFLNHNSDFCLSLGKFRPVLSLKHVAPPTLLGVLASPVFTYVHYGFLCAPLMYYVYIKHVYLMAWVFPLYIYLTSIWIVYMCLYTVWNYILRFTCLEHEITT